MKHLLLAATLLVPTLASAQAPVWLSNPAGQPYGAGNPLPTGLPPGAAQDGTDAPSVPTVGSGIRGWLSGIYYYILQLQNAQAGAGLRTIPGALTYAAGSTTTVATGGTAVTAATAGTIHTGFDLKNPATATEPLYFSLAGTAGTTETGATFALAAGASYHGTGGTAQALTVNAATTGHVFALQVY